MRRTYWLALGLLAVMRVVVIQPAPAQAVPVNIDEIIFQNGAVDSSVLAGTADFSIAGTTLTIVLTNTSSAATGGSAATNLLTGIGFTLPSGVSIDSTNAGTNDVRITAGSMPINFVPPIPGDIPDTEWGAANGVSMGPFNALPVGGSVNTAVATLQAAIDFDLAGTSQPPANVDGPDFGLLSNNVLPVTAGGLQAVQDSVTINLALLEMTPGDLLGLINSIDSNHVVLSFGSPTVSTVPEASTSFLFGIVLLGLLGYDWQKRKKTA